MRFYLMDVAPGAPSEDYMLENVGSRVANVAALWRLLGDNDRAERITEWWKSLPRVGFDEPLLDLFEIQDLLDLLGDPVARSEMTLTHHWQLRPEVVERVVREAPQLVAYDDLGGGVQVPALNRPLIDASDLNMFLRKAFAAGSRIGVD